jgi:hypothetical protein
MLPRFVTVRRRLWGAAVLSAATLLEANVVRAGSDGCIAGCIDGSPVDTVLSADDLKAAGTGVGVDPRQSDVARQTWEVGSQGVNLGFAVQDAASALGPTPVRMDNETDRVITPIH